MVICLVLVIYNVHMASRADADRFGKIICWAAAIASSIALVLFINEHKDCTHAR